ncbi:flagellar hook-associated family protein [Hyphomicrobium sp.]|uniref:flagellar hook-associated family protein n=1 Tax=Hyphomicrobium sp. TaxID=82 RepID=UPI0025BF671F|nr:flagellar hook-associated family protein [Hyphomicrobium sp.]MCC7253305.1 flagellar hook-associated family protein [Hyphomicrobium sp.]
MKTTNISTVAIVNATRNSRVSLQAKLVEAQKEANTGRFADVGMTLGYLTQRTVSLRQDYARLQTFKDTNTVASSRLELSQTVLDGLGSAAQEFLTTLMAARSAPSSAGVAITDAKNKLTSFAAAMNTTVNGVHIFAGVNTDVKPVTEYFGTSPSPAQSAMAAAFTTEFGMAQSAPGVENISGSDMEAFLNGAFADLFNDANWTTTWSSASDQNISSRISTNERIDTSTNANEGPFRAIAQAYTMIADIGLEDLNSEAYLAVINKAIEVVGQAVADLTQLRAGLGTAEERIAAANERIDIQKSLLNEHILQLEGVDTYEATVKVNSLLTQIETAYALTARLQNLSLLNHI